MRKTNDTSKLGRGTLEDHDMLADTDLDAVTGGAPKEPIKFPDIKGESTDSYHKDWVTYL